ncbi:MAG: hypothetical protein IT204_09825 [Fimbriimonadaceae bacterium]|nr:hypothetical protein [Fimbriimonadaceae bacterium]
MTKLLAGVLVGALLGWLWHKATLRWTGGGCPLLCSPWRALLLGGLLGALWSGAGTPPAAVGRQLVAPHPQEQVAMTTTKAAPGVPVHVNESSFEQLVRSSKQPILLDAYADWCGPCRVLAPQLETVAKNLAGAAVVAKFDVDANPRLAQQLGIRSIPALFVIRDGTVVDGWNGVSDAADLEARVRRHLP